MITLEQLNAIPRPGWLTPYEDTEEIAGKIYACTMDSRSEYSVGVAIVDTVEQLRDTPKVSVGTAGKTFEEKIELLQHAKAVVALFENPKVGFYR
jgi:hypothetical protein